MQRIAGSRKDLDRIRIEPLHLGERLRKIHLHIEKVTPSTGDDVDDGLPRVLRWAHRILIGVYVDALIGISKLGALGQCEVRFGQDGQRSQRGCTSGETEKGAAR